MRKIAPHSMVGVMKLGLIGKSGLGYLSTLVGAITLGIIDVFTVLNAVLVGLCHRKRFRILKKV
jgi:hypothetical protein